MTQQPTTEDRLSSLESEVAELKRQLTERISFEGLRTDVREVKSDVAGIKEDVSGLTQSMSMLVEIAREHRHAIAAVNAGQQQILEILHGKTTRND